MRVKLTALLIASTTLAAGVAQAQTAGVVTLRANTTSATTSVVPVLTWSTNPTATSCRASGGWSGTKSASGNETLTRITASTNYTLTCSWSAGSAQVSWVAPTKNTDGSALTNLAGFKVYYGTSTSSMTQSATLNDVSARSVSIGSLIPATWYFKVRVLNSSQVESADSNVASKTIAGATAAQTVAITVTAPTTTPPATKFLQTIQTTAYEVVPVGNNWGLGRAVGTVALGKPCSTSFEITLTHYRLVNTDVKLTQTPVSSVLVGRCVVQ